MSTIVLGESVFPLNEDGSVFHLGLCPGELAETVILVGDPERVPMVSRCFDHIELKRQKREFVTHTGSFSGRRISVISTGIGTSNIDIVLNEVDALHNIDFVRRQVRAEAVTLDIIRLGTCGGLQAGCQPGKLVVSFYAVGFDAVLGHYSFPKEPDVEAFYQVVEAAYERYPFGSAIYAAKASTHWCEKFRCLGQAGITLTCPGFYGPQHRGLRLSGIEQDIFSCGSDIEYRGFSVQNLEMETAMILGLGAALGHRCASLSTVVFNRVSEQVVGNLSACIDTMIEKALQIVVD